MRIAVTGGAGYVGAMLVPKLLSLGHSVTVLDTCWFGEGVFPTVQNHPNLTLIKGDIRKREDLWAAFRNAEAVIHLACISNDPSFEMNPDLGKSINYDAFQGIIDVVKECKVKRFIYASSSSVYGLREERDITEDMLCNPLTDYSKYKLMCERDLRKADMGDVVWTIIRPATVCGWSPRLRLDLIVNVLTISGLVNKKIIVHGGQQLRPNINISDMVRAYIAVLEAPKNKIHKETFNVGFENHSLHKIAMLVAKNLADPKIEIEYTQTNDNRSYHVNSDKIADKIGFRPIHSISRAVGSIVLNYTGGKIRNPLTNPLYYNVKRMKELGIT